MPDHPIIDAHVHLTDPSQISYPWTADVPALQRPWSLADFDALKGDVTIDAMVFVEVDAAWTDKLTEAAFVTGLAATDHRLKAMVAAVAMDQGAKTEAALDAMQGYPLLRGIRHLIERHTDTAGWACRPAMIDGVRRLAKRGLVFDLCLHHPQLADATALVRACPDVTFVLDHIGKPGIRAGLIEPWRDDLRALAALPNVLCKISGVVTEADHRAWTEDALMPYLTHALSVFGADRVMFGGDWPVSELATRYDRWVALVDRAVRPFGASFAARLWAGTAREVYRF
jgi:L-fuconolactonase